MPSLLSPILFEEFLLFTASLAKYKKRNLFKRQYILSPSVLLKKFCFFALPFRVPLIFYLIILIALLPETPIIKAKETRIGIYS
jgi:hypothetical protein